MTEGKARDKREDLEQAALHYHEQPVPGKLAIRALKPLGNQRDLALAYSPGVAAPCRAIADDPQKSFSYTSRGNLVAVISNGTAVLGLGAIGALASKPVMEGKAVLFKKFAGIDVFDIEVDELDVEKVVDVVAALEPTFGGINLEDIKAPECFEIEQKLKQRMKIPVFHDDQHGTAIIVGAAVKNAMEHVGKPLQDVKVVASGAGAAALACLNLLVRLGVQVKNIWVSDINGVLRNDREDLNPWNKVYAKNTTARELGDIMDGADIFLGLSAAGVLKPELLRKMSPNPLVMALANPTPEILPEQAKSIRDDVMMCTGRSDYPNQVNNVLCFPYIFRGALDVGATAINEDMKLAAVEAIAGLAREEPSDVAAQAYGGQVNTFGADYLIPSPFDQRLILRIAPAVAKEAMNSGVATRPITDFNAYQDRLNRFVFRSGMIMKPIIERAIANPARVVFSDGEDERVLRATQVCVQDGMARPIVIGRPAVVEARLARFGLKIKPGTDFELINPEDDPRYRKGVELLIEKTSRRGISPQAAEILARTNTTVIGALLVEMGEAEGMLCGLDGRYNRNLQHVDHIIGRKPGVKDLSALSMLIMGQGTYFLCDTYITQEPSALEVAEMTILAARHIRRFGLTPKAALLSHSDYGSHDSASARKMREAYAILQKEAPELEVDGEMHGDTALSETIRARLMPKSSLKGVANLLIFPNLDSANIALNLIKVIGDALHVGPILLGVNKPVHILTPSVTSRGVVNMTAYTVAEINDMRDRK